MTFISSCPCIACGKRIPTGHVMCNRHWISLPKRTRRRYLKYLKTCADHGISFDMLMLRQFVWQAAALEIETLRLQVTRAEQRARKAETETRAIRQGPHAHAALLAAQMAVQEMFDRAPG